MTDRELLELAAKAAGIVLHWHEPTKSAWVDGPQTWDPLTDDGDALRLAVKLSIELEWRADGRVVGISYTPTIHGHWAVVSESSREDRAANARRAIVRVAAEIGGAAP